MSKCIYEKMAITNMFKNGKIYLPYLITTIGSMMFYYILSSIGSNPNIFNLATGAEAFKGATILCGILQSGSFASAIFIFIFLLYANSFVLKHQKNQMGLYRVLGIERKHMIRIIVTEELLIFVVGIVAALFLGILFDKLALALLFQIIGQPLPAGFYFNINAIIQTLILTGCIALIILVFNTFSILSTKDIELLKSEKVGEKEPKNRPLQAVLGAVCLAAGYYIALKSMNAGTAINNFFPAALLVMVATYTLFTAGSISILKMLKKNKKFYYQTKHFISVSGMLYRMKQNATGLATICILSTATIIVLSAGMSLYANGERGINERFPRELLLDVATKSGDSVDECLQDAMRKEDFAAEDVVRCTYGTSIFEKTDTGIKTLDTVQFSGFENMPDTYILTLAEYNRFNQTNETLDNGEIFLYSSNDFYTKDTLTYLDTTYQIKGVANKECLRYIKNSTMSLFSDLLLVVPDEEVFEKFMSAYPEAVGTWVGFNSKHSEQECVAFMEAVSQVFSANGLECQFMIKVQEEQAFYSMYGGIMFIGAVLGILFILCTVMIIYYKQISEGYEDRERFLIMQKVGMSKEEVRSVIHTQVMLVFFLPLVTAIIHSAVALQIVENCLRMVVVVHGPTFILSVVVTCVIFSIAYMIVYKITSREYYKIVNA